MENKRRADGVYFVRSASDQTASNEPLLFLQVSDGRILRTAMQFFPELTADCVRDRFVRITGTVDEEEILTIENLDDDVDISKVNLPEFFIGREIPTAIIFRYLFSEVHHFREELQELCFAVIREYHTYCDANCVAPIAEIELAKRRKSALEMFETVWDWKEFIEQNHIACKDVLLAAVMLASTAYFFDGSTPAKDADRAEDLIFHEINYQVKNYVVDKATARKIKKIIHRMFENDEILRQELIAQEFFI